jgi:hypothetical protein
VQALRPELARKKKKKKKKKKTKKKQKKKKTALRTPRRFQAGCLFAVGDVTGDCRGGSWITGAGPGGRPDRPRVGAMAGGT